MSDLPVNTTATEEEDGDVVRTTMIIETSRVQKDEEADRPTRDARYIYDFGLLKRREREDFAHDMQQAYKGSDGDQRLDDADQIAAKWMVKLLVEAPEGCNFRDEEVFKDMSAIEWDYAIEDFGYQFLRDYKNKPVRR